MNIIETIRAEIERLKAKYRKDMYRSDYEGLASGYKIEAYNELISFLDTVEEQPVCEEFSKEFDEYFLPKNREQKGRWGFADIFSLARHFARWGAEWQYQKDRGEFAEIKAKTWSEGFDACGEQMMKEAVEGKVISIVIHDNGDEVHYSVTYPIGERPHSMSDKVKMLFL